MFKSLFKRTSLVDHWPTANEYVCAMETTTTPKRPGLKEVALKVAQTMMPEFKAWCESSDKEDSTLLDCLQQTFERYGDDDGYVIARMLEDDFGVEADEQLVSIMSRVEIETESEISKLTADWVDQHGIEPKFGVGETISGKYGLQRIIGKVRSIDRRRATYSLEVDGMSSWPTVKFEDATEQAVTETA